MKFRDLKVGQTFDFIDDENPRLTTFTPRCEKLSARKYASLNLGLVYRVGSINCNVYHVE